MSDTHGVSTAGMGIDVEADATPAFAWNWSDLAPEYARNWADVDPDSTWNWGMLIAVGSCLAFWATVILGSIVLL